MMPRSLARTLGVSHLSHLCSLSCIVHAHVGSVANVAFLLVRSWFDVMIRGPRSSLFALCSSSVFDGFFRCSSAVKFPFFPKFIRSSWPSVSLIHGFVHVVFVAAVASFSFRWTVYRMKGETGSRRLENSLSRFFASSSRVVIIPDAWALAPLHHFFVGEA